MVVLHLAPGVVTAMVAVTGGGQHQRVVAGTGHDIISVGIATPGRGATATGVVTLPLARNKRWSTTFGANSSNKNTNSKYDYDNPI